VHVSYGDLERHASGGATGAAVAGRFVEAAALDLGTRNLND
jgi:hypothetical protein